MIDTCSLSCSANCFWFHVIIIGNKLCSIRWEVSIYSSILLIGNLGDWHYNNIGICLPLIIYKIITILCHWHFWHSIVISVMLAVINDIFVNVLLYFIMYNNGQYCDFSWRFWKRWKVLEFSLNLLTLVELVLSLLFIHLLHLSATDFFPSTPIYYFICIQWPSFFGPMFNLSMFMFSFVSRITKKLEQVFIEW